jgi:CDGSH iron-sulfur domain-containing protein 3
MTHPVAAQKAPYATEVEEGKSYSWCACGLSNKQPLCDGSHKGTGLAPIRFTAPRTGKVYFCGCKESINRPLCDGTHAKI